MKGPSPHARLIRQARRERGLCQYKLADALSSVAGQDISREDVSRWERGKRLPGPYWRGWLSMVLKIPLDQLTAATRTARRERPGKA
ncbi:helix-turn-helix domain-containing protein [Saccharopolyspora hattusasensis]|uniref:helix-turn-helix domain-containing protein n=1 Tax=Saccharopolyspora hattusasensis TaxID=1128679 RepID=UPI003D98BE89